MYLELTPLSALSFSLAIALASYSLLYFVAGLRSDRFPAAIVLSVCMFSPWWAALAGAGAGHLIGILFAHAHAGQKPRISLGTNLALLVVVAAMSGFLYREYSLLYSALGIIRSDNESRWQSFSRLSPAHAFAERTYRPCIDKSISLFSDFLPKNEPAAKDCREHAISLAKMAKGQEFASAVTTAINSWNSTGVFMNYAAEEELNVVLNQLTLQNVNE